MGGITIAIVDDHPLFRAGVSRSLTETGHFNVVAEGSNRDDAVKLATIHEPEMVLLDISIPGGGIDALTAIMNEHPNLKVVMLTVSEAGGDVTRALRAGARGYVLKGIEADALADILMGIAAGDGYVSPALSARLLASEALGNVDDPPASDKLDERQQLIISLVATGLSNKQIALKLNCHEKTIKHQLTRIFFKLNVSNRTEAAMVFRNATENQLPASLRSLA